LEAFYFSRNDFKESATYLAGTLFFGFGKASRKRNLFSGRFIFSVLGKKCGEGDAQGEASPVVEMYGVVGN
jgi:hypothetical protein